MKKYFDENEIRKTIANIVPKGSVFECRIVKGTEKNPLCGYFKDVEVLIEALKHQTLEGCNVFITLNALNDACYSRKGHDCFIRYDKATGANDVVGIAYMLVDVDAKRPSGISSTDAEKKEAALVCKKIIKFMDTLGFYKPIKADSGNGYHLLYRILFKNTRERIELIKQCLQTLDVLFSNEKAEIDTSVYTASHMCKLYGTLAQKGFDSEERPHRLSKMYVESDATQVNDLKLLEKLALKYPKMERTQRTTASNDTNKQFDVEKFMDKYGIKWKKSAYKGGDRYDLDHCPFDESHKGRDAAVFRASDGRLGFKCFHNSCDGKGWKDFRILFEPDAYDKEVRDYDYKYEKNTHTNNRTSKVTSFIPDNNALKETKPREFLTSMDVEEMKIPDNEFIKTGIKQLDSTIGGFEKTCISVFSGLRGAGKSTILGQIILNCVQYGQRVICYSGELTPKRFYEWLLLQAAGRPHVVKSRTFKTSTVESNARQYILGWLNNQVFLYNNQRGNDFSQIANLLLNKIVELKADICIIDNLMALDISRYSDDKYEAQKDFVLDLKRIAQQTNTHIIFVAHPRKPKGLLRLDDISGSGDITNIVDNAFLVHRVDNDFKKNAKEYFGWSDDNKHFGCDNIIEISKNRRDGIQDFFIPLWFERETKRLLNEPLENFDYDWNVDYEIDSNGMFS